MPSPTDHAALSVQLSTLREQVAECNKLIAEPIVTTADVERLTSLLTTATYGSKRLLYLLQGRSG